MSLRNIRHWMNTARKARYCGPTEAAILTKAGDVIRIPDMRNWLATHKLLSTIKPEDVAATFILAPKGGWCGEAEVPGLRGTQNLYSRDHGNDLDFAIEAMIRLLMEHGLKMVDLRDPATRLDAMLATHDWYSWDSDAPGVALAGDHDWMQIVDLMAKVPAEMARTLFAKHAPEGQVCPV